MYKTIDLFSGAGGLSLGFEQSGYFQIIAAAEINPSARKTYSKNISKMKNEFVFIEDVKNCDFKKLNRELNGIDVVIGGPPCQGFSNANRQKKHIVNMNNTLVKEYFRAIREIKPKAFVMENVNMLKSETHKFYDSRFDHDEILNLGHKGTEIQMKDDFIFISNGNIENFDIIDISNNICLIEELLLPKELFSLIVSLDKKKDRQEKINIFVEKKSKIFLNKINQFLENTQSQNIYIETEREKVLKIKKFFSSFEKICCLEELNELIEIQRALLSLKEINDNQLIGRYEIIEDGSVVFHTKSYSVIDYIEAILDKEYMQSGMTLNAKDFGVPQERKRHIIIGIKREIMKETNFKSIPITNEIYTVEDAIFDLQEYDAKFDVSSDKIIYRKNDHISDYAKEMRIGSEGVANHVTTKTTKKALERFKAIPQGKNFHYLSANMKTSYSNPDRTQNTIYLRLDPKFPSGTVVNVRKSMWIHPVLDRAVTIREAARLQSFPDFFEFFGTKDSQYQQVGNAVPPKMAKEIAKMIYIYLNVI